MERRNQLVEVVLNNLTQARSQELDIKLRGRLPSDNRDLIFNQVNFFDSWAVRLGVSNRQLCEAYLNAHRDHFTMIHELTDYQKEGILTTEDAMSIGLNKGK